MTKPDNMKDIPGYEGLYAITEDGEVWSYANYRAKAHWKSQVDDKDGYKKVQLWRNNNGKNWTVHRLVLITYVDNPEKKMLINHKNGIKHDNRVENLEWCTAKENTQHAWETGLLSLTPRMLEAGRENARKQRKPVMQLTKDGILCRVYSSFQEASRITGAGVSHIGQCCSGERKTAGGYLWDYYITT